tara:strand:- start:2461 stop:2622 length:162 start_codon:yes stop_codon:yes gene_type:complete
MVELLQLLEAGLTLTAVSMTVVMAPAAIITGEPLPDISPMIEQSIHSDTTEEP